MHIRDVSRGREVSSASPTSTNTFCCRPLGMFPNSLSAAHWRGCSSSCGTPAVTQAPVTVNGNTLFLVQGVLSFPAEARAAAITRRIKDLSKNVMFKPEVSLVADAEGTTDIMAGDLVVMSVTNLDAKLAGTSRQELGKEYAGRIRSALSALRHRIQSQEPYPRWRLRRYRYRRLDAEFPLFGFAFPKLYKKLHSWRGTLIPSLRIQKFELLPADRIANFAIGVASSCVLSLFLSLCISTHLWSWAFSLGPEATHRFSSAMSRSLENRRRRLRCLPAQCVLYRGNRLGLALRDQVHPHHLRGDWKRDDHTPRLLPGVGGAHVQDCPVSHFHLYRDCDFSLLARVQIPGLPGDIHLPGRALFPWINIRRGQCVAGVILTYMRAFTLGDRVKIADTMGDVIEKTLLVTRIRTIKNVEITIANAMVLNSHIINFSASAQQEGLILHTSVTIGYDAPWRTVHQLLIDAALATENILKVPKPFVFQTALDDFYVHYELNAFTDQPSRMARIKP